MLCNNFRWWFGYIIKDRQKEFIDKDKIVWQEDFDFSDFDYRTLVAKCSCDVKDYDEYVDMKINKNKLLENFKNIKNIVNFEFLKCYYKLLCKEGILKKILVFIYYF